MIEGRGAALPNQDSNERERIPAVPISGQAIPKVGRDEPSAQVEPCEQTTNLNLFSLEKCTILGTLDSAWHQACLIDFRRPIKSRQF